VHWQHHFPPVLKITMLVDKGGIKTATAAPIARIG
jgi:hypothetical protein